MKYEIASSAKEALPPRNDKKWGHCERPKGAWQSHPNREGKRTLLETPPEGFKTKIASPSARNDRLGVFL